MQLEPIASIFCSDTTGKRILRDFTECFIEFFTEFYKEKFYLDSNSMAKLQLVLVFKNSY